MKRTILSVSLIILSLLLNTVVFGQKPKIQTERGSTKISVKYSGIRVLPGEGGVLIKWQTESETKNIGFLVFRVTAKGRELVGNTLIPGSYLKNREAEASGANYSAFDKAGDANSQYVIESINDAGQKQQSETVAADGAANLTAGDSATVKAAAQTNIDKIVNYDTLSVAGTIHNGAAQQPTTSLTDINVQRTIAGQPGVKIGVKKEGFYRVTKAELQAAGFNVTPTSANWKLYLNGIEQPIIVGGSGDYLEFYGKGIDTIETDTASYFLINGGTAGKRINTNSLRRLNAEVVGNSYFQTFERKERTTYVSGVLNGETGNYFGNLAYSTPFNDVFSLNNVDFNSNANVVLELSFQGLTTTAHQIDLQINGNALTSITGNNTESMSKTYTVPVSFLREGNNTLRITEPNGFGYSLVDTIRVSFSRKYNAVQNRLALTTSNYKTATLNGFTSANVRVFDLSNPDNPVLATNLNVFQNGATYSVKLPAYRSKNFYAVEDSGLMTAASVTANAPSTLSAAAHNANLLVISHGNFMTQANAWAAYRAGQGMSVEVVNIEDVYDEFNFGSLSANSIRDFLQYAENNWQTPPQYVLLVGDATYDPRNYEGRGNNNFVPTKLVDTVYSQTGSDEALADFNDDGLSEIAVGRIPARTGQAVTNALTKVQNFEANVATAQSRGAVFASDLPNGYDFEGVSSRLSQLLPTTMNKILINRAAADAPTALNNALNAGPYLAFYSGHGNAGVWASSSFFQSSTAAQLTNANNLSVYTMLTCLNGYFISPGDDSNVSGDSLSEILLKSTNGGAVAVWSSTGLTTPDVQEVMGNRFFGDITAGNITRLGDLIKDSKTTIPGGRDVRLSWCLLGDPTLKMK